MWYIYKDVLYVLIIMIYRVLHNKKGREKSLPNFELFPRIELGTSSLPRKCSTTELKQHLLPKSEAKVRQVFLFCNFFEHFFKKSFYPLQNSPAKGPTNNYKLRGVATQMEN